MLCCVCVWYVRDSNTMLSSCKQASYPCDYTCCVKMNLNNFVVGLYMPGPHNRGLTTSRSCHLVVCLQWTEFKKAKWAKMKYYSWLSTQWGLAMNLTLADNVFVSVLLDSFFFHGDNICLSACIHIMILGLKLPLPLPLPSTACTWFCQFMICFSNSQFWGHN